MSILQETEKHGDSLVTDINTDLFLNNLGLPFFLNKSIEVLIEHGSALKTDSSEIGTLLNAVRYLVAELEAKHSHEREQWVNTDIVQYLKNDL